MTDPVRTDETTEHDVELGSCFYCMQPIMESEWDETVQVGRYAIHGECGEEWIR